MKPKSSPLLILLICAVTGPGIVRCVAQGAHPSVWVYPSASGNLLYAIDTNGVRINDFSQCGYRRGQVELPNVTNVVEPSRWVYLSPLGGGRDDGPAINAALNSVGTNGPNANGFRGVVYLESGVFIVGPTNAIVLTNGGVVLKGSGSSPSTGTSVRATGFTQYDLITIQGDGERQFSSATAYMSEKLVPAGTRTFRVDTTNGFEIGDRLLIQRPVVSVWVHDLDMDQLHPPGWLGPSQDSGDYERILTRIEGDWLSVDTPLPQTFSSLYGGGVIQSFIWPMRIQNCGVEDLYCYSDYPSSSDANHAQTAVHWTRAENCWMRNVTAKYFGLFTFRADTRSTFITMADCQSLDPASPVSGGYRYSFYIDGQSQYVLARDCYASEGRHDFVLANQTPGPNAFVRGSTHNSHAESGPHEKWSTGVLLDNVSVHGEEIDVDNLGNGGGGGSIHGWSGGYASVWNCYAENGFRVRNPPSARNWLIGSDGSIMPSKFGCSWYDIFGFSATDCWAVGADPEGTYDQSGHDIFSKWPPVQLHSLYYAQLQQRLKWPGSEFREYRLGEIGWRGNDNNIAIDPSWQAYVQSRAGAQAAVTNVFDVIDPKEWTAFTFYFPTTPNEQVMAGSISLGLSFPPGDHHLYLDNVFDGVPRSFTDLGWVPSNDGAARYTLEVPAIWLQRGQLNVAIDGNCGVDFAMLNLQVAPVLPSLTGAFNPIDAYVRGGDYANQNFYTNTELIVKQDSDASFRRRALLTWDLVQIGYPSYPGQVVDAKVRLYCNYSGQPGNEQSVAVVPDHSWDPSTVTWNNQPAADPPFAYWVPQPGFFAEFTVTPQFASFLVSPSKRFSLCIDSARDWGSHGDVAYASSEDPIPNHRPQLILSFSDSPPSIVGPLSQSMGTNTTLGPLPVTIGDAETPAESLMLTATSSVPSVIANSEILLAGSGSNRTVSVRIPAGRTGVTFITLITSDGAQVVTTSFQVVVNCSLPIHVAPAISDVTNKLTDEDTPLTVPFYAGYPFDPCADDLLSIQASSTNRQLFPSANLQILPHSGASNHVLVITPAPYQNGSAAITIVAGGFSATNRTFVVTVRPVQHPPQYVRISSPRSGDNLLPGVPALLSADAFDVETNLTRIEFYRQPHQLLGVATNAPYWMTWSNPPAGSPTLYAIAYDTTGLSATSAPITLTVSVPVVYAPRLFVGSMSNLVVLIWPDSVSSNALQTTTSLVPPITWSPVTIAPQESDGAWFYFVNPSDPRRFFRLAQ